MRKFLILAALLIAVPASAQVQPNEFPSGVTPPIFGNPSAVTGGGVVTSSQLLLPDGTAALPALAFTADPDTGWLRSSTGSITFSSDTTPQFRISPTQMWMASAVQFGWSSSDVSAAFPDTILVREAASHTFQRNSTNAQRASWANTYTSSTNYEAFSVDWQTTANQATVGTRTAATGTARALFVAAQNNNAADTYVGLRLNTGNSSPIRLGYLNAAGTAQAQNSFTSFVTIGETSNTATSGTFNNTTIAPTYNQASGTAANTDLLIDRTATAIGSGQQNFIDAKRATVSQFRVSAGSTTHGTQISTAQQTVPTCSASCGTSPSVAGSDTAMTVTMGASGVPASPFTITFNGTWAAAPACVVSMALAGMVVGKLPLTVATTTTTISIVTNGTAPATSDKYHVHCLGIQ